MAGTIYEKLGFLIDQAIKMNEEYPDKIVGQIPMKAFLMESLKGFFAIPDSLRKVDSKDIEIIYRVK